MYFLWNQFYWRYIVTILPILQCSWLTDICLFSTCRSWFLIQCLFLTGVAPVSLSHSSGVQPRFTLPTTWFQSWFKLFLEFIISISTYTDLSCHFFWFGKLKGLLIISGRNINLCDRLVLSKISELCIRLTLNEIISTWILGNQIGLMRKSIDSHWTFNLSLNRILILVTIHFMLVRPIEIQSYNWQTTLFLSNIRTNLYLCLWSGME